MVLMMIYKKIMVAIDGSEVSDFAIQEAIKLIQDQDAQLHIVHVLDETFVYNGGPGFDYPSFVVLMKEEGQTILNNAALLVENQSSIQVKKSLVQLKTLNGRVAELIVEEATDWGADLLVVGTHGRRGFSRLFLGSVAENIIRIATTPVLLIRMPQKE